MTFGHCSSIGSFYTNEWRPLWVSFPCGQRQARIYQEWMCLRLTTFLFLLFLRLVALLFNIRFGMTWYGFPLVWTIFLDYPLEYPSGLCYTILYEYSIMWTGIFSASFSFWHWMVTTWLVLLLDIFSSYLGLVDFEFVSGIPHFFLYIFTHVTAI